MPEFSPVAWQPLPAPRLSDEFEENDLLKAATLWTIGSVGPEDLAVGAGGTLYTGTEDGTLVSVSPSGSVRPVAELGGRPLGVERYGDDLLICNAERGIQLATIGGTVTTLVDEFDGAPLTLANNATVAADGTIYFSQSSTRWGFHDHITDLIEGQITGRVLARSPDGAVRLVVDGLQFANGVALDPDGMSLFIAETGRYRVHRHWLAGEGAGTTELFLDNLPGFPDNLSVSDSTLWVPLVSPRQAVVDFMAPRRWMRSLTYRLPDAVKPKAARHGIVLGYDMNGQITHNLQDSTGTVAITTGARFHDGRLFIGSLSEPHIAVLDLT